MITGQNRTEAHDVGTHSLGFASIDRDSNGVPIELLECLSVIHDGGVGPEGAKRAQSRKEIAGIARRTMRRFAQNRKNLDKLDRYLTGVLGWPLTEYGTGNGSDDPWAARALLSTTNLDHDPELRNSLLSVAARHIARHRGWRNPYEDISRVLKYAERSASFPAIQTHFTGLTGQEFGPDVTVGEMVHAARVQDAQIKVRGGQKIKNFKGKKLDAAIDEPLELAARNRKDNEVGQGILSAVGAYQRDNVYELRKIERVQGLPREVVDHLITLIFHQEPPTGAAGRVGKDVLPGQQDKDRAWRATPAFQRYRIAAQLANVRVRTPGRGQNEKMAPDQIRSAMEYLSTFSGAKTDDPPSWNDVSDHLGLEPGTLVAPVDPLDDGEQVSGRPCIDKTHRTLFHADCTPVRKLWRGLTSDSERRAAAVFLMSNVDAFSPETEDEMKLEDMLVAAIEDMTEADFEKLENVSVEAGRAAYSEDSLIRLTDHILSTGDDLHAARKAVFGVSDDWTPPVPALTEPTGNPAVDRNLAQIARLAAETMDKYGCPPERVNIEHVRDGFASAKAAREHKSESDTRANNRAELIKSLGLEGTPSPAVIRRHESVSRQDGQCFYCGQTIAADDCELDHIVPRSGPGSNNSKSNLVAACVRCNRSKSNTPYRLWQPGCGIAGTEESEIIERMESWNTAQMPGGNGAGRGKKINEKFRSSIKARLRRTKPDMDLDDRTMESTAWAAREAARRLRAFYAELGHDVDVRVFKGQTVAIARKTVVGTDDQGNEVSVQKSVRMHGGMGKQRLDRRHHGVDAAVSSLMRQYPSQVLAERDALRREDELGIKGRGKTWDPGQWDRYEGQTGGYRAAFAKWKAAMAALIPILDEALAQDQVPVVRPPRYRLYQGRVHEDGVYKNEHHRLGDPWTPEEVSQIIDRRYWTAITRCEDFTWRKGLPENPDRTINIRGQIVGPDDHVAVTQGNNQPLAVQGGWVSAGGQYHHMRLYRASGGGAAPNIIREKILVADLHRYQNKGDNTGGDLFSVQLPLSSASRRTGTNAGPGTRPYVEHMQGQTEYLGWITVGDELFIPAEAMAGLRKPNANVQALQDALGNPITRWTVSGTSGGQVDLKPAQVSVEGLRTLWPEDPKRVEDMSKFLSGNGWKASINTVFALPGVAVIRRDHLGRERWAEGGQGPISRVLVPES